MLVLSRNDGQSIKIGDDIEVMLVRSVNGRAMLGIRAPDDVRINRREIYERIRGGEVDRRANVQAGVAAHPSKAPSETGR